MDCALSMNFCELSQTEMVVIDGGVDWESVGAGLGIAGAACLTIACAPASAFVGASYGILCVGAAVSGAAAGCYIGSRLAS